MEKYGYLKLASKIYGVLGWIAIGVSPLVLIGGIVAGAMTKGVGVGILLGIFYTVMAGISGLMLLANSQGMIWMIDMEGHAAAIRDASHAAPKEG
jgi:hypothetical protein